MELTLGNFYIYINLGGLFATIITPFLRNSNGGESYTLVFAVGVSTFFIASGNFTIFFIKSKLINLHFLLCCSCIGNGSFYVCCFQSHQECFKGFFSLHFGLYNYFNYFNFITNSVWKTLIYFLDWIEK